MKSQSISVKETSLSNDLNPTCRRVADLELVQRALAGDPEAFTTLFNTHKTTIYSICLRMTNNIAQAEDLTQDAFLQVFRKLSTFRGNSALSTWLYRIAVNTVLMHFRKKVLKQVSLDETYRSQLNPSAPGTWQSRRQARRIGGSHHAGPGHHGFAAWLQNYFPVARGRRV